MDSNEILLSSLNDLDTALHEMNRQYEIIVCGGFVIWRRFGLRKSVDLDILSPEYSQELADMAQKIYEKNKGGLIADWINWKAATNLGVDEGLPAGWQKRALAEGPLFQGASGSLTIYGLARHDLIATKLAAYVSNERDKDLEDLAALGVTAIEVDSMLDDVVGLVLTRSKQIATKWRGKKQIERLKHAISFIGREDLEKKKSEMKKKND